MKEENTEEYEEGFFVRIIDRLKQYKTRKQLKEELEFLERGVSERNRRLEKLEDLNAEKEKKINELERVKSEKEKGLSRLQRELNDTKKVAEKLGNQVSKLMSGNNIIKGKKIRCVGGRISKQRLIHYTGAHRAMEIFVEGRPAVADVVKGAGHR